ncbi:type II 3-dehydroquinate dehydratase [candidate division KSB1 bacterium]|nr:type II 3-dehydroquinate dehydratase [candidate division KSB1 bacterium]
MYKILILHGPNLNLLGEREPEVYGHTTLRELNDMLYAYSRERKVELIIHQSNSEGVLIDLLHEYRTWANGVIINPGALTHYSYSIRDAIAGIQLPTVEVHISDIKSREPFRKVSVIEDVCIAQLYGYGIKGYSKALDTLIRFLEEEKTRAR